MHTINSKISLFLLFLGVSTKLFSQNSPLVNLKYEIDETLTYQEAIGAYKLLDKHFETARLLTYGMTDAGKPLNLFVMSKSKNFDPKTIKEKEIPVLLINNGIHPGEPGGIDASIKFADEVLRNANGLGKILDNTVICIVPVLNIGGALNRSAYHRMNQDSPKECGFRGNAKKLDLNRDFSKADAKNTLSFYEIFQDWDPDIFIDTHTTNGSDHQYVMTLIHSQPECLHPELNRLYRKSMKPFLWKEMSQTPYELTPYVKMKASDPKDGLLSWAASPRFTNGYSILFNTISFVTETHVFKPYTDRVLSIYHFITQVAKYMNSNGKAIKEIRKQAVEDTKLQKEFTVGWIEDTTRWEPIVFKGYERKLIPSKLSNNQRVHYDRSKPYTKTIRFYDHYLPSEVVKKPKYYVVPQAWSRVIERLQANNVEMSKLKNDTSLLVESYYIKSYRSIKEPYSAHFYFDDLELESRMQKVNYHKGDYIIEMNQKSNRYIVEMLEPKAVDSFFRWNFFNSCLEQSEFYSDYAFEEKALGVLERNPEVKKEFYRKLKTDTRFQEDYKAQLEFIYKRSRYAEKSYMRYPVARIN